MEKEKKKAERVEVSLVLGEERSWKPVSNGQRFVNAVQTVRRADLRDVFEYVHGWGAFSEQIDAPSREQINFIPRAQLGHQDVSEVLRLVEEARGRVQAAIDKAKNPLPEQTTLSFRMVIPNE